MLLEQNRRHDVMFERLMAQFTQMHVHKWPQTDGSSGSQGGAENPTPAYPTMPNLSKDVQTFDGKKGRTVAKEWLHNIESQQQLCNWSESFALETARSHLQGDAHHCLTRKKGVMT